MSGYDLTGIAPAAAPAAAKEFTGSVGISGARWYSGHTIKETTGSATASVTVHNGSSASDAIIGDINLAAGESLPPTILNERIPAPNGIWIEVSDGAVAGTIFYEK